MAESVDSQLRNTIRAARSRSLRCVKAIIVQKGALLQAAWFLCVSDFLLFIRCLTMLSPREAPWRVELQPRLPTR